jgi:hypothetical protein
MGVVSAGMIGGCNDGTGGIGGSVEDIVGSHIHH